MVDDFDIKSVIIVGLGALVGTFGLVILKQCYDLEKEKARVPVDMEDYKIVKEDLATFVCATLSQYNGDKSKFISFMNVGDSILRDPKVKKAAEKYYNSGSRDMEGLMYLYALFAGEED